MKLAEITDLIGFMEKSEPLRLIFDSLASDTSLTMAGISFSYRNGNKRADGNVFGGEIRKFSWGIPLAIGITSIIFILFSDCF